MTGNGDFTKRIYFRGVEKVVPTHALRNSPAQTYAIEKSEADVASPSGAASDTMTTGELLSRAKRNIGSSETSLRAAAEDIARAYDQGATQREVAEGVGKSPAWVNRLLKWREGGYVGAPFADKVVQGVNKEPVPLEPPSIEPAPPTDLGETEVVASGVQEAVNAGCVARVNVVELDDSATADAGEGHAATKAFSGDQRARLIETLEFLVTDRPRLRAQFALNVERRRAELGLTWDQLLIPAGELAT